jgi:mycothiol system anti-sigma-R factor
MTNETDKPEVVDSDCLAAMDHLYAYLNGELGDKVAFATVEHHLAHCKSCYSRAEIEREINKRIKESGKDRTPDSLQNRLHKLIDEIE